MKIRTMCLSNILATAVIGGFLFLGLGYSSISHAEQGCGFGNHLNADGRCIPNGNGGFGATKSIPNPHCWYNVNGKLHCN